MKQKIKQYFYDSHDLRCGIKCPNDYKFWYFLLLDIPLEIIAFLMVSFLFFKGLGK